MKDGFITVATATPQVAVADCEANTQAILACINEMAAAHAKVMVLPELCITGYTCSDLFWQTKLLDEAEAALSVIAEESRQVDALIAVGMPLRVAGKLLNVAAILCRGVLRNTPLYVWVCRYGYGPVRRRRDTRRHQPAVFLRKRGGSLRGR